DFDHAGGAQGVSTPAWTPDGQWILAAADRTPDAEYSLEGGEIYAFGVKDGPVRQLTHRKGPDANPVPSPDGRKIAYTGHDYKGKEYSVDHLYVMDTDGSHPRLLTGSLDRDASRPYWSADSKELYFTAEDRGATHLYRATLDGKVSQITTPRERFGGYAGSETASVANGRVAAVRSTPSQPSDVVTFTVEQPAKVTRLTASNDSLLAG